MNRRDFLRGVGVAGTVAVAAPLAAGTGRDHEVADGRYALATLAGEPLLAAVSERSVAVSWAVSRLATGGVEIADNAALRGARFVKAGDDGPVAALSAISLQVRVEGLRAATRYWYRTVTEEIVSGRHPLYADIRRGERRVGGVHSFVTSGAAGESRFGVINDTHAQWDSFAYVAKRFREMKFPVGIWNGDALNCTEERRTAVETFLCPDVPTQDFAAETPLLFLPGNHEYAGEYARQIDEVMPCRPLAERGVAYAALKWNFAVRQGDIALIGLDTGDGIHDDDRRLCGLGAFSPYRRLQTQWLAAALQRPEIVAAPFKVAFCHIPLHAAKPEANGCERPLACGCAAWVRECSEQWGPLFDRHGIQLVVAGHVHAHRWDDETGFGWKQVTGGGPEMGYGAGFKPKPSAAPTIIEGRVENGQLAVRVYDVWRERLLSERRLNRALSPQPHFAVFVKNSQLKRDRLALPL